MAASKKPDDKVAPENAAVAPVEFEVPHGFVLLAHPEGVGCSLRGNYVKPNHKGHIMVSAADVEELSAHGFLVA